MTRVPATAVAWALWILALVAIVTGAALAVTYPPASVIEEFSLVDEVLWSSSWLGFGLVGALIVSKRSDNRIGWVLCAVTFAISTVILAAPYARAAAELQLPLGSAAAWIGAWMFVPVTALVVVLLLIYPTGRLVSRRQRWLLTGLALVAGADTIVHAIRPGPIEGDGPPLNPLGIPALEEQLDAAAAVLGPAIAAIALLVVLDAVGRYRRSAGVQRQQFRWFALAAAAFPVLFVVGILLEDHVFGASGFDPVPVVFLVCGNGLAAAIGVAVTRYGLYEINRVISRSVAYVLLTAVLGGIYLGSVTVLSTATSEITGDSPLAVAAATLLAAAAFGPARRRIQSMVDHRFNRARYDASMTIDGYRSRIRDEVELERLTSDLLATVRMSMQPSTAALWLGGATPAKGQEMSAGTISVTVPERPRATRDT